MSTRSKWLDWKPDSQETSILEKAARCEPQKPQKPLTDPGYLGFLGSPPGVSPKIEVKLPPQGQSESNTSGGYKPAETPSLKGQAVELWRDGRRFFLVADEGDALEAIRRFGAHRGEVWTSGELELVASIPDQATRDEVESFKRQMDGSLSAGATGKCISAAEWQTQMLNQLFKEQGVRGQPAEITAKTVKHGERGRK